MKLAVIGNESQLMFLVRKPQDIIGELPRIIVYIPPNRCPYIKISRSMIEHIIDRSPAIWLIPPHVRQLALGVLEHLSHHTDLTGRVPDSAWVLLDAIHESINDPVVRAACEELFAMRIERKSSC
jgi:hypothetical protein